jgi:hypothetical protein
MRTRYSAALGEDRPPGDLADQVGTVLPATVRGSRLHLSNISPLVVFGYVVAVTAFALWNGRWPERAVGATVMAVFLSEYPQPLLSTFPTWLGLAGDVVILIVCVFCALRSDRYWTIAASSFALLSVVTHVLHDAHGVGLWAFLSAELVWTTMLVAALLVGALSARRAGEAPGVRA